MADDSAPEKSSASNQLLTRVAEALQVPRSAFYAPPNAVDAKICSPASALPSGQVDGEGAELLRAYTRISDPEERRRILTLVQAVAERP